MTSSTEFTSLLSSGAVNERREEEKFLLYGLNTIYHPAAIIHFITITKQFTTVSPLIHLIDFALTSTYDIWEISQNKTLPDATAEIHYGL